MKLSHHIAASTVLGGGMYASSGSPVLAISAFISGVLIDLDHVVDYLFFANDKFTVRNFFTWYHKNLWDRFAVVLHSWELMFLLTVLSCLFQHPVIIGIASGACLHMLMDQIANSRTVPLHRFFYFFAFRMSKGFQRKLILVESGASI